MCMALRVARIPYLSCEPFYFEMARRGIELCDIVPSAMAGAAARGEIDAGPMPLADCFALDDQFRFLSGFCLATIRQAGSEGLRQRHGVWDYPHTYDLGEEWSQWTSLPFVFARWVVRKTLDRKEVSMLEDMLYAGMQDWA